LYGSPLQVPGRVCTYSRARAGHKEPSVDVISPLCLQPAPRAPVGIAGLWICWPISATSSARARTHTRMPIHATCGKAQKLKHVYVHQVARNLKPLLCSEPGHQDQRVDMWCAVCEIMICVQVCFHAPMSLLSLNASSDSGLGPIIANSAPCIGTETTT
jgi:hypothetical protein